MLSTQAFVTQFVTQLSPVAYTVVRERHTEETAGYEECPYHLHALVKLKALAWTPGQVKTLVSACFPSDWKRIHFGRIAKHSTPLKAYQYLLKDPVGDVIQFGPKPKMPHHWSTLELAKYFNCTPDQALADCQATRRKCDYRAAEFVARNHWYRLSTVLIWLKSRYFPSFCESHILPDSNKKRITSSHPYIYGLNL